MESRIAQAEGIGNHQLLVRQHACLQPVTVPMFCNVLGQVGTYSKHLHATLVELSAQFLEPA